jgi:hypothetical protein
MDFQQEAIETLRQLTLQIMLVSAGVFGIVGGFVSAADKVFVKRAFLAIALVLFAISTLVGYMLHGVLISLFNAEVFDPFNPKLVWMGVIQIGTFFVAGVCFTVFVIVNLKK